MAGPYRERWYYSHGSPGELCTECGGGRRSVNTLFYNTHTSYVTGGRVSSVELYLPWNNTWVSLPPLPVFTDGGTQHQMTYTQMLWLPASPYPLHLLGGCSDRRYCTRDVWGLQRREDTYYWTTDNIPPLGTHHNIYTTVITNILFTTLQIETWPYGGPQ